MRIGPAIALWLLACTGPLLVAQDGPSKTVDVENLLRSLDEPVFDARAFLTLVDLGPRAAPRLLELVRSTVGAVDEPARRRLARALRALRMLGPSVAPTAVPELLGLLGRATNATVEDLANTILQLTSCLPPDAWSDIEATAANFLATRSATSRVSSAKRMLAHSLHDFAVHASKPAPTSLDDEIAALSDSDPAMRACAAERLHRRRSLDPTALDEIRSSIPMIEDSRESTFELMNLTRQFHVELGNWIHDQLSVVLAHSAPQDPLARRGLALLLSADDPRDRVNAAMALGAPPAENPLDVSKELLAATSDDDPLVAGEAVTALGRVGHSSPEIEDRLKHLVAAGGALGARARIALAHLDPSRPRKR